MAGQGGDGPSGLEGRWVVESIAIGGELQPTLDQVTLTLEVEGRRVSGWSGVNRFSGRLDGDTLFGSLSSTRRSGPHELMAQEQIYLQHLSTVETFEAAAEGMSLIAGELIVVTLISPDSRPGVSDRARTS